MTAAHTTQPFTSAPAGRFHPPGALPPPPGHPLLPTSWYQNAVVSIRLTVRTKAIAVVSGPSGVGKTDTVSAVLANEPGGFAYMDLAHRSGMKDVIESLHTALHGPQDAHANGRHRTTRSLRADIENTLTHDRTGVVADEIHYVGEGCMLTLAQIWERVRVSNGVGFPLFLVGANAPRAIHASAELLTRIRYPIRIGALPEDEIVQFVQQLSPRCAATTESRLRLFDQQHAHGVFRVWHQFIEFAELLPQLQRTALTREEINQYMDAHASLRVPDTRL